MYWIFAAEKFDLLLLYIISVKEEMQIDDNGELVNQAIRKLWIFQV
jgi:hypothetical protein